MEENSDVFSLVEEIKSMLDGMRSKLEEYPRKMSAQRQVEECKPYFSIVTDVVMEVESRAGGSIGQCKDRHSDAEDKQSFFMFMEEVIARLKRLGKFRTSETYTAALDSFRRFRAYRDLLPDEITSDIMMEYEAYLIGRGVSRNTISFYNRILRATYNRAVQQELTAQCNPFRNVYTGMEKTVKRAIPVEAIRRIKELDLSLEPALEFVRDIFLFSFYTRGMSFVDMAYLKKSDLRNGILSYRRKKTGQRLHIKWERCMQEIVDKHPNTTTEYLLPLITDPASSGRRQYDNALHLVNRKLKRVAEMARLSIPLTMYVSRHSWASIAKRKNIPLSVISEGMGHDSEMTTQIYLSSLDTAVIDRANALIIKNL